MLTSGELGCKGGLGLVPQGNLIQAGTCRSLEAADSVAHATVRSGRLPGGFSSQDPSLGPAMLLPRSRRIHLAVRQNAPGSVAADLAGCLTDDRWISESQPQVRLSQ
jgi:hypothetical protein